MKYWMLLLSIVTATASADLIRYTSVGSLSLWEGPHTPVGEYSFSLLYDSVSQTFYDGNFESDLISGPAELSFGNYGPWYDYPGGWDFTSNGMHISDGTSTAYFRFFEAIVYVPEDLDPRQNLDHTTYYAFFTINGDEDNKLAAYAEGFKKEILSVTQVPEPTSLALLGLGLAGIVARRQWKTLLNK